MPTLLSLFDYSGHWSEPYERAGWTVVRVDLKHGHDLRTWHPHDAGLLPGQVRGVLAAPPCTDFASSGAQYWPKKDADGTTAASVALVTRVLLIIDHLAPAFWALENPVGRLNTCIPALVAWGPRYFNPSDYGDPYTKRTGLWGNFHMPEREPTPVTRFTDQGSWIQSLGGKSARTKTLRSTTPLGFAYAFFRSNP